MNKSFKMIISVLLAVCFLALGTACKKRESAYIGKWYLASAQAASIDIDVSDLDFEMYIFVNDDGTAEINLPGQTARTVKWEENEEGLYIMLDKENAINCKIVNGQLGMVEPASGLTVYFDRAPNVEP
ncbi:MAG: hypothetical protein IJR47_01930 [Clostridia bacterium]|nr:hypothetical protein [Clostridia bacterium]